MLCVPVIRAPSGTKTAISKSARCLPPELVDLVVDYAGAVDYMLLQRIGLHFDPIGRLTNPNIRAAFKEAFVSSYCSQAEKNALLHTVAVSAISSCYLREFIKIFHELADAGYRLNFDGVDLSGLSFTGLKWTGASLRHADLTNTVFIAMDMIGADLTGAIVNGGQWFKVNLTEANLSGADLTSLCAMGDVTLHGTIGLDTDPEDLAHS